MKIEQLYKATSEYDYLVLRDSENRLMAINCKVAELKTVKTRAISHSKTKSYFTSYRPCNFMEYITLKRPFFK